MEPQVIYNIQAAPYWDWKVAADLFFGGAGVGALLFAVGIHTAFKDRYLRICGTAAMLAPVLVLTGLIFLLLKMGRPLELWLALVHYAPSSPLWWGSLLQTLLVVGSIAYAVLWWSPRKGELTRQKILGWALAPLAVLVGTYHGALLAAVPSRPLWNHGPTVVSSILAFVATGIAAVMLVHLLRMRMGGRLVAGEPLERFLEDMKVVRNLLVAALVLQIGTALLWWLDLSYSGARTEQALEAANASYGPMFWGLGIGVGLVLPLALGAYSLWSGRQGRGGPRQQITTIAVTGALVLIGGFFFRLAVVLAGQVPLPVATLH